MKLHRELRARYVETKPLTTTTSRFVLIRTAQNLLEGAVVCLVVIVVAVFLACAFGWAMLKGTDVGSVDGDG